MVDSHFQNAGAPVDYSSPTTYSNTMTAGYSPTLEPVTVGSDMSIIGGNQSALDTASATQDSCKLFGGGRRRSRKSKRSRKLKRSNKSRLSTRSKKSRSKSRSKVKKLSKKSLRKSKRNKRKSLR